VDSELTLMRSWTRLGVTFTVAPETRTVDIEDLVARTAEVAPRNERLFVMAATWLGDRHVLVDARRLIAAVATLEPHESAVAGALLTVADQATVGTTALGAAAAHCRPLRRIEPLFDAFRHHERLLKLVKRETLPVFREWGFWHNDATLAPDALRPVQWTLRNCPELRYRALLGSGLDARIAEELSRQPSTVAELATAAGATYAATHAAASRLAGRGLIERRSSQGERKRWHISPTLVRATATAFGVA
jgi:hypothetical protein